MSQTHCQDAKRSVCPQGTESGSIRGRDVKLSLWEGTGSGVHTVISGDSRSGAVLRGLVQELLLDVWFAPHESGPSAEPLPSANFPRGDMTPLRPVDAEALSGKPYRPQPGLHKPIFPPFQLFLSAFRRPARSTQTSDFCQPLGVTQFHKAVNL
ncbi:hypothetical protein EYF80_043637 [Liparis tanakae]|uniref:Uncharacterized protein n=1 Tax=Liparis tanakae TaxID=230148 RepID=A0A4Z2FZ49_9TELE|nr:hypothetical protein EYF80_043637 [Liparis tanakae]